HKDCLVIIFWDEMPLMLEKIRQQTGPKEAMDLLDTLRSLRQMSKNLRMVFTGSIGLHHVISSLRKSGYANSPINDMLRIEVLPLSIDAGQDLAARLLEGENIPTKNPQALGRLIARAVDGIPYFIHHVVGRAARNHGPLTEKGIEDIVAEGLTHSLDAWDMHHYRERIDTYFSAEERNTALKTLDILAQAKKPLGFEALLNLIKTEMVMDDPEKVRRVLALLKNDHYVEQDAEGDYRFKFPLIQRWWKLDRGA
ncbi:MAG: ATP-binding protein, partial [Planctomycetes bacterium]|nr:ATP-binding protein [Planctomycetota bacterium]